MSQYPQQYPQYPQAPYPPPPGYGQPPMDLSHYQPTGDLLAPARRAGTLMIVIGVLLALFGACNGGAAFILPDEALQEQLAQQQAAMQSAGLPDSPALSISMLKTLSAVVGGVILLIGVTLLINGMYVRRGSPTAVTVGLVFCGGLALLVGGLALLTLLAALVAPPSAVTACFLSIPLLMLIWVVTLLIPATRNNAAINAARQQYQAQMYGYYQQQQAYAQPGYVYAQQPNPGYSYPQQQQPPPQQPQQPQQPTPPQPPTDTSQG